MHHKLHNWLWLVSASKIFNPCHVILFGFLLVSRMSNFLCFLSFVQWILSLVFWRKKATRTKYAHMLYEKWYCCTYKARRCLLMLLIFVRYTFGHSNNNVGLLLLLDKSPRMSQWRCLATTQGWLRLLDMCLSGCSPKRMCHCSKTWNGNWLNYCVWIVTKKTTVFGSALFGGSHTSLPLDSSFCFLL